MTADLDQKSVLLLDDEKLVRLTIATWLKATDFSLTVAATPTEAVELVRKHRFDAIVTDVMMEGMDGFMFRDYVRAVSRDVPVIFLTSLVNDADNTFMRKVMSDFNSYYVPKDSPREYLIGKLQQVVRSFRAELRLANVNRDLENSLNLARIVQQSMMPSWAYIGPRYYYGTLWRPYEVVSGDAAYIHPLGDDSLLCVMGDVSGHGVSAALAMSAVLAFLRRYDTFDDKSSRDVRRVAEEIDRFVSTNLNGVAYMTATVMYFNARERIMRFLNAGNADFLCFRRMTGEEVLLNPEKRGCTPLGLVPDAVFREDDVVETEIPDNAVILYLSDGLTDQATDETGSDCVPMDLVREVASEIVRNPRNGLCAIPFSLYASLEQLGYTCPQDDVTAVAFGLQPTDEKVVGFTIAMDPVGIDEAAQRLGAFIREVHPELDDLSVKAELLLAEHLMNVYDHGLSGYKRHREVSVMRAHFEQDYLVVSIWDRGRAWSGSSEVRSRVNEKLEAQNASLDSHGRGEAIVRQLSVRLSRQRLVNLNRSVYYLPLSAHSKEGGLIES